MAGHRESGIKRAGRRNRIDGGHGVFGSVREDVLGLRLAACGGSEEAHSGVTAIDLEGSNCDPPGGIRLGGARELDAVLVERKRCNLQEHLLAGLPAGAGEGRLLARRVIGLVGIECGKREDFRAGERAIRASTAGQPPRRRGATGQSPFVGGRHASRAGRRTCRSRECKRRWMQSRRFHQRRQPGAHGRYWAIWPPCDRRAPPGGPDL